MKYLKLNKLNIKQVKKYSVIVGVAAVIFSIISIGSKFKAVKAIESNQPNVVVIIVDDLDVGSLNVALYQGWMPNLKNYIIDKGITFNQSFVSESLCCPSRSTFLTGQYPHNHGVLSNEPPTGGVTKLKDNSTIATWLKNVGYRTCYIGKYLNGYGNDLITNSALDDPTYIPPGWDDWQATVGGSTYQNYNYTINDNGQLVSYGAAPKDYQTDVLANRAVTFINESETINDAQPFFLVVTPLAPHSENGLRVYKMNVGYVKTIRPAPRHKGTASQILLPPSPSFNEQNISDKPDFFQRKVVLLTTQDIYALQRVYQDKIESIRAVDDLIGNIVSTLNSTEELDNTIIFFTSDNGFLFGQHRLHGKRLVYEEAVRVPLFIRVPKLSTPQLVEQLVINNDLAPTIADLAGATPDITLDGRSLRPLFKNPSLASWRKRFLIEYEFEDNSLQSQPATSLNINDPDSETSQATSTRAYFAVRTSFNDEKTPNELYVEYGGGKTEFYDLTSDPYQIQSLAEQNGLRQQQMKMLHDKLINLKKCKGESCQIWEDM